MAQFWQWLALIQLIPVVAGTIYGGLTVWAAFVFCRRRAPRRPPEFWPSVTILKPVHGLEKDLGINLRSACRQDYPDYQVVFSVQRLDDPAIPLLREIAREFGGQRVTVAIRDSLPVLNGKIQNLEIALAAARHEVLVISDSDVRLRADYLKTIVAPLADPRIGGVCTLYRACRAESRCEKLELLTLNADFTPNLMFAATTGAADFCLGASTALRRTVLEQIGGLEGLAHFLVEDYEMGRRIRAAGLDLIILPYFVDMMVDLPGVAAWWRHQVYWDQNTRAARPWGFLATIVTRAVPFALLFALLRLGDGLSLAVLATAVTLRLAATAAILARIGDHEGLAALLWLPVRDLAGLASWLITLNQRRFVWRGLEFGLTDDGRIVPRAT
ncbi:MAG: glycosyltransferase [Azospirillum sp.]|nr:glycosyltransferase [Azospirillum sp.]